MVSGSVLIRDAHELDAVQILPMMERYWQEMPEHLRGEFRLDCAAEGFIHLFNLPGRVGLVAVQDGKLIGLFVGVVAPVHWWNQEKHGIDLILYVLPEHRGSTAAVKLLKAWEDCAKASGAKSVRISVASGFSTERTGRLYERLGYTQLGSLYSKE